MLSGPLDPGTCSTDVLFLQANALPCFSVSGQRRRAEPPDYRSLSWGGCAITVCSCCPSHSAPRNAPPTQASNSASYIQDAFQLLMPILEISHIQRSAASPENRRRWKPFEELRPEGEKLLVAPFWGFVKHRSIHEASWPTGTPLLLQKQTGKHFIITLLLKKFFYWKKSNENL